TQPPGGDPGTDPRPRRYRPRLLSAEVAAGEVVAGRGGLRAEVGYKPSSDSKLPASKRSLMVARNRIASAPSTSRWSYVSARYIMDRGTTISPRFGSSTTTARLTTVPVQIGRAH